VNTDPVVSCSEASLPGHDDRVPASDASLHDTTGLAFVIACSHPSLSIVYYDRTWKWTKG